ncbi:MAG TPA: hypothetical protein VN624_04110, partial [Rhodanobacter sp.]|nr:hypothetical protein [Rhodanobacter sp.]
MKTVPLHRSTLFFGIALALLTPAAALSQTAPDDQTGAQNQQTQDPQSTQKDETKPTPDKVAVLETVVVTGVRGSLARSTELKRDAGTVQ